MPLVYSCLADGFPSELGSHTSNSIYLTESSVHLSAVAWASPHGCQCEEVTFYYTDFNRASVWFLPIFDINGYQPAAG